MKHVYAIFVLGLALLMTGTSLSAADEILQESAVRVSSRLRDAYGIESRVSKQKASKKHDRVTIEINESATAKHEATTELEKSSSISTSLTKWFTLDVDGDGNILANPRTGTKVPEIDVSSKRSHEGDGETERTQTFKTTISGEVLDVLPNRQLVVAARKVIKINEEEQQIELTGRVDPSDLTSGSVIDANYIIDLRIRFVGRGEITESTKRGWFAKFIDAVTPF